MLKDHLSVQSVVVCFAIVGLGLSAACKQEAGSMPAPPVAQVEVVTVQTQTFPMNRSLSVKRRHPVRLRSVRKSREF